MTQLCHWQYNVQPPFLKALATNLQSMPFKDCALFLEAEQEHVWDEGEGLSTPAMLARCNAAMLVCMRRTKVSWDPEALMTGPPSSASSKLAYTGERAMLLRRLTSLAVFCNTITSHATCSTSLRPYRGCSRFQKPFAPVVAGNHARRCPAGHGCPSTRHVTMPARGSAVEFTGPS